MGQLQTYFYLVVIGAIATAAWLVLTAIALRLSLRGLRTGEHRLTFLLTTGATLAALAFIVISLIGIAISVARNGHGA